MRKHNIRIISNFLTPTKDKQLAYYDNYLLESDSNGKIILFEPITSNTSLSQYRDLRDKIIIPGLIDAHVHLPQLPITGLYGKTLLEWLKKYAYPAEIAFKNTKYAKQLAHTFFSSLKATGTTSAVVYSSIHKDSTTAAFYEAEKSNLRIKMGKVMMDNEPEHALNESTFVTLKESYALMEEYNNRSDKISYAFTPRFAVNCTEGLLRETAKMAKSKGVFIQTHMSENQKEVEQVKKLFGKSYAEIYRSSGLLYEKTLLAHCIHLSDNEIDIIKKADSKIIHCPDSNLFLQSGRFPIEKYLEADIDIGLGSDVGAGTTLDMFKIMKSMIYMQNCGSKYHVMPGEAFYYATYGNAKVLGLEKQIGSIEKGKLAEMTVLSFNKNDADSRDKSEILSGLIFGNNYSVFDVII